MLNMQNFLNSYRKRGAIKANVKAALYLQGFQLLGW